MGKFSCILIPWEQKSESVGVLWVWPTSAPRLDVPERSPPYKTMPIMRHVVSQNLRGFGHLRSLAMMAKEHGQNNLAYPSDFDLMDWLISQRLPSGSAKCAVRSPQR